MLGIVAVAGNLPLAETERNARRVCELAGRPEHRRLCRLRAADAASAGDRGRDLTATALGEKLGLPEPAMPLRAQHGVDFIIETLRAAEPGASPYARSGR